MPYVIENLEQYEMTDDEAEKLERLGLIFPNTESDDPEQRETTARVWEELELEGSRAFVLFDAVLGRVDAAHGYALPPERS